MIHQTRNVVDAVCAAFEKELEALAGCYRQGREWESGISSCYKNIREIFNRTFSPEERSALIARFNDPGRIFDQRQLYGRMYISYEKALAEKALSFRALEDFLLSDIYLQEMIETAYAEYQAADIRQARHVLCVGSGAVPVVAISYMLFSAAEKHGNIGELLATLKGPADSEAGRNLLRQLLNTPEFSDGLRITGIDCDPEMLELSEKLIKHFGVRGISVFPGDGRTFKIQEVCDRIVFSGIVQDKEQILHNLLGQVNCADVVIRTVPEESLGILLYEPMPANTIAKVSGKFPLKVKKEILPESRSEAIYASTIVLAYQSGKA